jgi:flagellar basal-body rod protein FlgC
MTSSIRFSCLAHRLLGPECSGNPDARAFRKPRQRPVDRQHAGRGCLSRKTISFSWELDRTIGASRAEVSKIDVDPAEFTIEYDPGNPAADRNGMVKLPNVNVLVELADMREANRSYEANLQTVKQTRELVSMTIDLLRAGQ